MVKQQCIHTSEYFIIQVATYWHRQKHGCILEEILWMKNKFLKFIYCIISLAWNVYKSKLLKANTRLVTGWGHSVTWLWQKALYRCTRSVINLDFLMSNPSGLDCKFPYHFSSIIYSSLNLRKAGIIFSLRRNKHRHLWWLPKGLLNELWRSPLILMLPLKRKG